MEKEGRRSSRVQKRASESRRKSDSQSVPPESSNKENRATARNDEDPTALEETLNMDEQGDGDKESIKPIDVVVDPGGTEEEIPEDQRPTEQDITEGLCKEYADELLDFALDLCHERFVHIYAPDLVSWDLRDSLLDVVTNNWMDTDKGILDKPPFASTMFSTKEDMPPLPPKFDFWSHGALETLPTPCRESIMDPFLRDSVPWTPASTKVEDSETEGSEREALVRPTSPVPSDTDETWSRTTLAGNSFSKQDDEHGSGKDNKSSASSPRSAGSMARMKERLRNASFELVYPTKFPAVEMKASSEIAYNMNRGMRGKGGGDEKINELIAFKLPFQTSSESIRVHYDRQKQQEIERQKEIDQNIEAERRRLSEEKSKLERKSEGGRKSESERKSKTERKSESERKSQIERKGQIERKSESEQETELDLRSESERKSKIDRKSESEQETELDLRSESDRRSVT